MLAADPSLRARAREAAAEVERVVADVNQLGLEMQRAELAAIAPELLATGEAYVCECDAETLRKNREAMRACVHRIQDVDETIAMWKAMLAGEYGEGEAVVRLKTDMAHPNPAFRDRVLFRVAVREHPRVGTRYRVWPMLEFSWAVDDALLGVTHVLRGRDLVMEDLMEARMWEIPAGPKVQVAREDFEKFRGNEVRLKDFCNVVLDHRARFVSMPNKDIPKIQWVTHGVQTHLVLPDGSESRGLSEPLVGSLQVDDVVQFERVGFARIDHVSKAEVRAYFAHR